MLFEHRNPRNGPHRLKRFVVGHVEKGSEFRVRVPCSRPSVSMRSGMAPINHSLLPPLPPVHIPFFEQEITETTEKKIGDRRMAVAFKELGGSPVETYAPGGFFGRRQFLIAWEDRDAFAAEVLGQSAQFGSAPSLTYPGKTSVFATTVRFEPLDPGKPRSASADQSDAGAHQLQPFVRQGGRSTTARWPSATGPTDPKTRPTRSSATK